MFLDLMLKETILLKSDSTYDRYGVTDLHIIWPVYHWWKIPV